MEKVLEKERIDGAVCPECGLKLKHHLDLNGSLHTVRQTKRDYTNGSGAEHKPLITNMYVQLLGVT